MTPIPIPIYPKVTEAALSVLRAAKAQLDTQTKIVPVDALQGSPGPILALGVRPDWLTDYVFVKPDGVDDPDRVAKALAHWLNGGKTHDEAAWMSAVMGCGVTFAGTEPHEPKVGFG